MFETVTGISATTCARVGVLQQKWLIRAVGQHFAFGGELVGILDMNVQTRGVQQLLYAGQIHGMRCARAEASDTPRRKGGIDGYEAVFTHVERYRLSLMIASESCCEKNTVGEENYRTRPL